MTPQQEIIERFREKFNPELENIEYEDGTFLNEHIESFLEFELTTLIEKQRESADKLEHIIKDIQSYSPDGEIGTLCNQALDQVLSLKSLQ